MSWRDTTIETKAFGGSESARIARPALVMHFYGDGRLNDHALAIFDAWRTRLPAKTTLFGMGSKSRSYRKLAAGGIETIRGTLAAKVLRTSEGAFHTLKDAPGFDVGGHSFETNAGHTPEQYDEEMAVNDVHMAWPIETPTEEAVATFRFFVETFPFHHAAASFGFDLVWGREGEQVALPILLRAALANVGLDLRDRETERFLHHEIKGPAWLLFLDGTFLSRLGDEAARLRLDGVDCMSCRDGAILRAGAEPPVNAIAPLVVMNRFVQPIRTRQLMSSNLYKHADPASWLTRLD